jgi:hypothetical protein
MVVSCPVPDGKYDGLVDAVRRVVEVKVAQVDCEVHRLAEVPLRCVLKCARDCVLYFLVCHCSPP